MINLGEPAALITNRSTAKAKSITVKLVATKSHRDAVGTTVSIKRSDGESSYQLTAGNGYQASSQRTVVLPAMPNQQEAALSIAWQDGSTARFSIPVSGKRFVLVQGQKPAPVP